MPLTALPLNTSDIPRSDLDIRDQVRTNPLPWRGQFSPQLVESLLTRYAEPGAAVLDPFVGSGTVLGECARLGLAASGTEINPAAVILAHLYEWANQPRAERKIAVDALVASIDRLVARKHCIDGDITASAPLRPQDVAACVRTTPSPHERRLLEAALVLADPAWSEVAVGRLMDARRRVREFLLGLPYSERPINVFHADARNVPIRDGTVDLVLTSPPYINVFNYHQQYRPAVDYAAALKVTIA